MNVFTTHKRFFLFSHVSTKLLLKIFTFFLRRFFTSVQVTTSTDVGTTSADAEAGAAADVEQQPGVTSSGDEATAASPGVEMASSSAAELATEHGPAAVTLDDDRQKQADADVVEMRAAAEVVTATSADDRHEEETAQAEQVREQTPRGHETAGVADAAPEQRREEPCAVTEEGGTVDAPAAETAAPDVPSVEPSAQQAHVEPQTPLADENEHLQQVSSAATEPPLPSVDVAAEERREDAGDVRVVSEEPPQTAPEAIHQPGDVDVEATDVTDTAADDSASKPPDVVAAGSASAAEVGEESTAEQRQTAAEETPWSGDVVVSPRHDSVAAPATDDSASKPPDVVAAAGSAAEVGEIQPEELPPPLTPDRDVAAAPAPAGCEQDPAGATPVSNEHDQSSPATDRQHVDLALSEQPHHEMHAVSDAVVDEPTSASLSAESAEHCADVAALTGQP